MPSHQWGLLISEMGPHMTSSCLMFWQGWDVNTNGILTKLHSFSVCFLLTCISDGHVSWKQILQSKLFRWVRLWGFRDAEAYRSSPLDYGPPNLLCRDMIFEKVIMRVGSVTTVFLPRVWKAAPLRLKSQEDLEPLEMPWERGFKYGDLFNLTFTLKFCPVELTHSGIHSFKGK